MSDRRRRAERKAARRSAERRGTTPEDVARSVADALLADRLPHAAVTRARWLGSWAAQRAYELLGLDMSFPYPPFAPRPRAPSRSETRGFGWMVEDGAGEQRVVASGGAGFERLVERLRGEGEDVDLEFDYVDDVARSGVLRAALRADLMDQECVLALQALEFLRLVAPDEYVDVLGGAGWWHYWEAMICSGLLRLSFGSAEKPWLVNDAMDGQSLWWPMEVAAYSSGKPFHRAGALALQAGLRALELGQRAPRLVTVRVHVDAGRQRGASSDPEVAVTAPDAALLGREPVAFLRGGAGPSFAGASVTTDVLRGSRGWGDWIAIRLQPWVEERDAFSAAQGRPVFVYEVDGTLAEGRP